MSTPKLPGLGSPWRQRGPPWGEDEVAAQTQRTPHHCPPRDSLPSSHHHLPPTPSLPHIPPHHLPPALGLCVFFLEHSSPTYLLGWFPCFIQVCAPMSPWLSPWPQCHLPAPLAHSPPGLLGSVSTPGHLSLH